MAIRTFLVLAALCCFLMLPACAPSEAESDTADAAEAPAQAEAEVEDLLIAEGGQTEAVVFVHPDAEGAERQAADDLAHYIGLMSGATPEVVADVEQARQAREGEGPAFLVGRLALELRPALQQALDGVTKADPVIRADAVALQRDGNALYLAGTNDASHYHAVAKLLHDWGCRWYLPTEIGEAIPEHESLMLGHYDFAYAPPFEVRGYWIAWNGSREGAADFSLRNFMNGQSFAGKGHALAGYTGELAPEGGNHYNVPFAEPETAETVVGNMAGSMEQRPGAGISLAIEDGAYENDSEIDAHYQAGLTEKYFLQPNMTDPMMAMYANVGRLLDEQHPDNPTRFGGMAYSNVTIPPQWEHEIADRLVLWLAPIDIDPAHGMDDPNSPPRQEYREMMYRWADLMDGRLIIYDYDQGMLVWRDIPNPSHMAFVHDVKHYEKAGILGVSTESRNAIATVFTNLHFRGQLMWDTGYDVEAALEEFYEKFYGPAAGPMGQYWDTIYERWENTIVTEHEHFVIPAVYTPAVVEELDGYMAEANDAIASLEGREARSRNEALYVQRMEMARAVHRLLSLTTQMMTAAATEGDYVRAGELGREALAARIALAEMNPTFTTRVVGSQAQSREPGGSAAWFPGEVLQYIELGQLTNGEAGTLVKLLPLEWAFRRDRNDTGLASGFAYREADLTYWNENHQDYDIDSLKDYPTTEWEVIRTDLYPQAQGVRHPDYQSFTGFLWYKTDVELTPEEAEGAVHIRFPGAFNEAWLYVNGYLVDHRSQRAMWWRNNYRYEWDVDLTGKLREGENDITVRFNNPHHWGGIFRRPFLYRPQ